MQHETETAGHEERLRSAQSRYVLPPGAREILLVRHGSTDGDKVDTLAFGELTIADPPLLPRGHLQAKALAERLRHEPLTHIFVTPLQRTHQTAAPLAAATGLVPIVVPGLREAHLGDWEHEFYQHAAAGDPLLKRMLAEENWEVIPNAEPMAHFAARVLEGINEIVAATEPGSASAAFLHAGSIAEVCRQATASRPFAFFGPENTSISKLVVNADGSWSLRSFNDVAHLQGAEF